MALYIIMAPRQHYSSFVLGSSQSSPVSLHALRGRGLLHPAKDGGQVPSAGRDRGSHKVEFSSFLPRWHSFLT